MPYSNPESNEAFRQPVGLDRVLNSLRESFNQISWLDGNVYLRAYDNTFPDEQGNNVTNPQVYVGNGEYLNVMINDNLNGALFFKVEGAERVLYDKPASQRIISYERPMALIFWCNLKRLDADFISDYIYTELIKERLMEVLAKSSDVKSITQYLDDNFQEVFDGYTLPKGKQYSKFPFACIKINFLVNYRTGVTPCYPSLSHL